MSDPSTIHYMNNVYLPQRQGGYRASHCVNANQIAAISKKSL